MTASVAIPEVFGAGALTFGRSYLFVVVLLLGAFALKGEGGAARAILNWSSRATDHENSKPPIVMPPSTTSI